MDSFVSRKRQRISSPPSDAHGGDNESTDYKLAVLSSLQPAFDQQTLLDILLAHDGSVDLALQSLAEPVAADVRKPSRVPGYQSSLASFATRVEPDSSAKRAKLLSRKGKTLFLYSPEDIAAHTPCSIIHNFLPAKDANDLLEELLVEAPTFERMTFKLFDNVVSSPHTAAFYVESLEEQKRQEAEYIYNGDLLTDVRQLTPHMRRLSPVVEEAVNKEVALRIQHNTDGKKLRYQSPHPWKPNAAFVNSYNGGGESVGYHSDQLTYVGPRAIIGSISLGVTREFRVRRIVPQDAGTDSSANGKKKEDADASGQISIPLPHNSLLVMHAEMQEEWKHSIAPAAAIDPHPLSGNRRINITYRDYKPYLHPHLTPKCRCGVPTVLRVVQRKKENWGRYFWQCHAGNVPGQQGCNYFHWAKFTDDGEPIWDKDKVETTGS